jgi:Lon protease-like protein
MDLDARLGHLPIFPLPSVQLFPHAILPLHVFEPRYQALLSDALAADRLLAIADLGDDFDPADDGPRLRPAVRAVCGVGEVIAHERLADGRSNILLHGVARVRILEEPEPPESVHPYRVVRAERLDDMYQPGVDLGGAQRALLTLADALAARLPSGGDTLRSLARSHADPGALSDVLGAAIVTTASARRSLLEMLDVASRVDAVSTAIALALDRFDPPPTMARGGGHLN